MMFFITMIIFSPITAIIPGIYAMYLIGKKRESVEKNYLNIGLMILFIWSSLVAIINGSVLSFAGSMLLLVYFSMGVFSQKFFVKRKRINKGFKWLAYLTSLTAVNGIIEKFVYMYITNMTGREANPYSNRIISSYGNPNMTGAWFSISILIILYLKSITSSKKQNAIYNLCIFIISIALILTESTGAFIALISALICYYILKNIKDMKKIIIAILCITAISGVLMTFQSKGELKGIINEISTSFTSRYDIWTGSIKMIQKKTIMGWGLLSTMEHGKEFFYRNGNSIHSHNTYITFLVSTGIIGLLIYLFIKYKLIRDLYKMYKKEEPMLPVLASINMFIIVQGLVDCPLYAPQIGMLFIMSSSMVFNFSNNRIKDENRKSSKEKGEVKAIELEAKTIVV